MTPIYVTNLDYRVSTLTGSDIVGALLDVYTVTEGGKIEYTVKAKPFPTREEAREWAFNHGYLKVYTPKAK